MNLKSICGISTIVLFLILLATVFSYFSGLLFNNLPIAILIISIEIILFLIFIVIYFKLGLKSANGYDYYLTSKGIKKEFRLKFGMEVPMIGVIDGRIQCIMSFVGKDYTVEETEEFFKNKAEAEKRMLDSLKTKEKN